MARLILGVLISGRGSNLQALIDACAAPDFPAEIALVISNKADAAGLGPRQTRRHRNSRRSPIASRISRARLDSALRAAGVELVCLAGFMRVLSGAFVARWHDRIINIHPSLLPAFPGLDTHRRALEAGVAEAGCTVHYVREEVDAGPIILQERVPVLPGDTEASLAARVLDAEHRIYPAAVRMLAEGRK